MASSSQQLSLPLPGRKPGPKGPRGDAGGAGRGKGGGPKRSRGGGGGDDGGPLPPIVDASLAEEARRRYLNYALSVITSRALPDARDGLKPVQRRILYTMGQLRLTPEGRPRKSAAVVGEVLGKYHPHGDTAVYDAMVRLAQDWVMRAPLIDGQGNFGSVDGDMPAAMRYTEAKLRPLAGELLGELGQRTVEWRPNYDGTLSEPVVLPARFPNLLVNGSQGIAVGMATSIPPHNLGEVIDACLAMIEAHDPKNALWPKGPPRFDELSTFRLLTHVKGPDFPTGGELLASKRDLEAVYTAGHGSLRLRGEWKIEGDERRGSTPTIIITSIPYAVERGAIVEKIAEVILSKKLPSLVDVRDESTGDIRVVCELKKGADPQLVMAYLYKNTPLSVSVQVNLTCLVPAGGPPGAADAGDDESPPSVTSPRRLSLGEMLGEFLRFRFSTVTRRLAFELSELERRIHVLEGLEIVFDALDEIIKIIRKSEGRPDAQKKLMSRFELSEVQTDAILDLRLYRLARLEILMVQKELADKRAEAKRLGGLLKSDAKRWDLIKGELSEIKKTYGDKAAGGARRTKVIGEASEPEFQAEDFIALEDANVILSAQGWVKRLRAVRDLGQTRLREGDSVLAATAGSTRSSVAFFSNLGGCYVTRVHDVPASTGYGDPVQKLFKLADGERMVAMLGFDPRVLEVPPAAEDAPPEPPFAVAVTKRGLGFRFSLRQHRDPSTRAGRKFARLNPGDEIIKVFLATEGAWVMCAASDGHALGVEVEELPLLSSAGKGSMVMKVDATAELVGACLGFADRDTLVVETDKGKTMSLTLQRIEGTRGGRGDVIVKRDRFVRVIAEPAAMPALEEG